jgi:hypothetical protein
MKNVLTFSFCIAAMAGTLGAAPLSYELRSKTIGHRYPLKNGVPERIIEDGQISAEQYLGYLIDMHHILEFLEQQIIEEQNPSMALLDGAHTDRTSALAKDINMLRRQFPSSIPVASSTAKEYREYLETLADKPHRYVAHIWVVYQYLASSGWRCGATIGKDIKIGREALNTYGYGGNLRLMRSELRNRIDLLELSKHEQRNVIEIEIPVALQNMDEILKVRQWTANAIHDNSTW